MPLGPVLRSILGSALSPTLGEGGGGSIISAIFADGTDGFYFDFSKTDRLFQTTTGGAPADDAGENIGLTLEGSKWGGLSFPAATDAQAEQVGTNPNFSSDIAGWGSAGSATVTWDSDGGNGAALVDVTGAAGRIADSQVFAFTVGKTYRFRARIKAGTYSGQLALRAAATNLGSAISPTGSYADYDGIFVAGTTDVAIDISRLTANTGTFYVDSISIKEIPGNHGLQATAAAQPKWQTGGIARFDGSDDNWLTTKIAGATGFIMARCKPTSGAALQVLVGAVGASGTDRIYLGVDASNQAVCRIGNGAALAGSVSIAGVDGTIGVRWNGTTVDLLVNGVVVATQAQVGLPTTTTPLRVGGHNSNGTAANFFTGDAWDVIEADKALTDAAALAIHNQLMAA